MQQTHGQNKQNIEKQLCERLKINSDFVEKNVTVANHQYKGYYLNTLVNLPATLSEINHKVQGEPNESYADKFRFERDPSLDQLSNEILQGKLVLFDIEGLVMVISPEKLDISRSVGPPQSENPLQSAFDAFTEDIDINLGMLRKKMVSDQLVIETRSTGVRSTKKLAVVYIKGAAPDRVIESILGKLEENKEQEVTTVRDLLGVLGHPKFTITPTYISSELPGEMVQNLMNGRVVILIDQFSFAFAFPAIVTDLWSTTLDVNYPYLFQIFLRTVRAIAAFLAITLPGLYVVLNSVNPELLRIQLAITVAKSREGVPYPSLIEMLLVMLLLEMIIEATIRLPKNIGPTITMIGGILLGQAIVQAKLVSNLLLIILVASAIANFALVGYMNTTGIRIYKYVVMLISTFFGIWGLEVAMIWFVLYLASLKISTVPYLSFSVKGKATDE
ncbi:spore germination protein [Paenibacillus endoradicis]|uniref:spore germination protein n=1 Tax=Paenibacillus endoradicis TaxID=2972487 RepID=UPI0021599933|nr:spore germination protein [Paenibacillus endoradicis]MCR8656585.1 spore germination protein [Paenibacillus endoradicis]